MRVGKGNEGVSQQCRIHSMTVGGISSLMPVAIEGMIFARSLPR